MLLEPEIFDRKIQDNIYVGLTNTQDMILKCDVHKEEECEELSVKDEKDKSEIICGSHI